MTVVDVHAHLAVPAADALLEGQDGLLAELAEERAGHSGPSLRVNAEQLRSVTPAMTNPGQRLDAMDAMGVDLQVVGPMPMHHYWAGPALAGTLARVTNEAVAGHCRRAPGRLRGLGTIPLQHPKLAAAELEHAVRDLGLAGASVSTRVAGRELADPAHDEVWARAEELGALIFIHPWGCSLGDRLAAHYLGNVVGQPAETTVALSHIIFSGLLDRRPGLRLCAAHGGGYLPACIGRSDHAWQVRPDARGCAEPPSHYLRRMWFDALTYTAAGLEQLVRAAGADRVLLGTDYPFDMGIDDPLRRLGAAALDDSQRAAIAGGNALALLGIGAEGD